MKGGREPRGRVGRTELGVKDLQRQCLFKYFHVASVLIGGAGGVGQGPRLSALLRCNRCLYGNNKTASSVQVHNGASKTGHESATLQDLASRKGVLQPGRAAALSSTPSCLSNVLVGAVERWKSPSLGYGP